MSNILNRPTLVLNRHWQPVGVAPVARALVMIWNDVALVVEPTHFTVHNWADWAELTPRSDEACIRAARVRIRVPEVVTLRRYERLPSNAVTFSRRNVAKRDHHTCQYCGVQPGWDAITIDHVIPRAQGGASSWTNCVAACVPCNARKADRTPEQAGMVLRKSPARPDWKPLYATHGLRLECWSSFLNEERALAFA